MRAPVVVIPRRVAITERIEFTDEDGRITMTQVMPTGLSAAVDHGPDALHRITLTDGQVNCSMAR